MPSIKGNPTSLTLVLIHQFRAQQRWHLRASHDICIIVLYDHISSTERMIFMGLKNHIPYLLIIRNCKTFFLLLIFIAMEWNEMRLKPKTRCLFAIAASSSQFEFQEIAAVAWPHDNSSQRKVFRPLSTSIVSYIYECIWKYFFRVMGKFPSAPVCV